MLQISVYTCMYLLGPQMWKGSDVCKSFGIQNQSEFIIIGTKECHKWCRIEITKL